MTGPLSGMRKLCEHRKLRGFLDFSNLITGYDQLAKNVYYIARVENGAYRFYFAPWDMDLTFGYTSDPDFPWGTKYESYLYENYIWWEPGNRLMKTDAAGARTLAQERYASLRETVLTDEWFARELENLQHTVVDSGAFERDRHAGRRVIMRAIMRRCLRTRRNGWPGWMRL